MQCVEIEHRRERRLVLDPAAADHREQQQRKPMTDASMTRPGRMLRRYRPINIAIGIVANTVAVAHGLCFIALTTIKPSTAIRMTMIISVPISAA